MHVAASREASVKKKGVESRWLSCLFFPHHPDDGWPTTAFSIQREEEEEEKEE
jgi:hypothetical protein